MRYLVITLFFTLSLAITSSNTYACDCRRISQQQAFEKSRAIFVGEFTGYTYGRMNGKRSRISRFRVDRQWKGNLGHEIVLPLVDIPGCDIDLKLVPGRKYLLYATDYKGELVVFVDCGRSQEIKDASEEVKYLDGAQAR